MTETQAPTNPWMQRIGVALTVLPALFLFMSAGMKLSQHPDVLAGLAHAGFSADVIVPIGVVEAVATVLYLVPATCVLGAILLTGYLGGAVVTHLRLGEPFITPILLGVVLWGALFLRDARVRALLPLRR